MPFTFIRRRTASEDPAAAPARRRIFTAALFADIGIFAGVYVLCLFGLALTSPQPFESLAEGQRAPTTVIAQVDFTCRDLETTTLRRHQASEEVRPVFAIRRSGAHEALRTISRLAERARLRRAEMAGSIPLPAVSAPAVSPAAPALPAEPAALAPQTPPPAEMATEAAENPPKTAKIAENAAEIASKTAKKPKKAEKIAEKPEKSAENGGESVLPAEKTAKIAENGGETSENAPETAQNALSPAPNAPSPIGKTVSAAEPAAAAPDPLSLPSPDLDASTQQLLAASLADAASVLDVPLSGEAIASLFPAGREQEAATILVDTLRQATASGLVSAADRESGFGGLAPARELALTAPGGDGYLLRSLSALSTPEEAARAFAQAASAALERAGISAAPDDLAALVAGKLAGDLVFDPAATTAARAAAAEQVTTALCSFRIGDTLMEERQRVTEQTREILSAHARRLSELESPSARRRHRTGRALILLLAQLMCLAWERISRRGLLPHGATGIRRKWLLAFLAVLTVALALAGRALCASQPLLPMWLLPYLLPLSAAAILAALFADGATGLAAALWLGLACDMLFGKNGGVAIPAFAASASAVLVLHRVHKRSQIMRAGLLSGAVAALVAAAYAVMQRLPGEAAAAQAAAALAGGFLSGTIATLLLPACEWMFGFTTGVTFLELTDAGHPLLRRLAVEAPGTYHHSLMVAALASAAAEKIGADALEVTVEAYFHDIGKLAKPEFFTENQRGGDNPHDELAPAMSALVIQSHVKEGLSLAKRYRLPAVVRQAIASHHGTSLASFFYQIAKKEADAAGLPEAPGLEASFRYEGPRPRTKEHAILMLADGVEAASRSLEKPSPQHIRTLVERMAAARVADGQLDESPLSLKEIAEIRESLVFSLWNMRHGRTSYPPRHTDLPAKRA